MFGNTLAVPVGTTAVKLLAIVAQKVIKKKGFIVFLMRVYIYVRKALKNGFSIMVQLGAKLRIF